MYWRYLVAMGVTLLAGCAREPSSELIMSTRMITLLDRAVVKYRCPEVRQLVFKEADPFIAAAAFARGGKELQGWAPDPIDKFVEMPPRISDGLDSLRAAVAEMGKGFDQSVAAAQSAERECYGTFALNCDKRSRAENVLYHLEYGMIQGAFERYVRHREQLAKLYKKEGLPLDPAPACARTPY